MRIDDIDPDELDSKIESRRRLRRILTLAAVVLPLLALAGFVVVKATNDDVGTEAVGAAGVSDTVTDETEADEPAVVFEPQGPNEFPDFGSDFMGDELPLLTKRTNDAGISMTVQKMDWAGFRGGGVFMEEGMAFPAGVPMTVPMPIPETTIVVEPTSAATIPADSSDGPSRPNTSPPPPPPAPFPPDTTSSNGTGGWEPAGWCFATSGFRVTMSHDDSVGTSQGQMYDEVRDDMAATLFSSGYAEGKPFKVLVLQVSPAVTAASVQFAGGGADAAAAENGFVVLGTVGEGVARFTVTLQIDGGERVIQSTDIGTEGDAGWQQACNPPPPSLPGPGEQPDDPVAAEALVRDVFTREFDRSIPAEDKVGLLDDDTGVAEAVAAVDAGGFGEIAKTARHTMKDLVFTSPTEAWFEYSIDTTAGVFDGRFGVARFDGQWRLLRAVVCQDLQLAGVTCNPPVKDIQPPAG